MSPEHDEHLHEAPVSRRPIYAGRLIRVFDDTVRLPDGRETHREVVEHPGAVTIVAIDASDRVVLVRQWRHAWLTTAWEVPAGTMEPGEEPLACAQRELREEAGLIANDWTPLGISRGTALLTGRQHLFLARGLRRVQRTPEPAERDMILREVPFQTALDAALGGEIEHAAAISALVRAARVLGLI